MSQGLNLVCQPPLTLAVTIPSIRERYALAPTVRAQLMAGNSNSWDVVDNHTSLPTGINLQAPQLPVRSPQFSAYCNIARVYVCPQNSSTEEHYPIKLSNEGSVMHVRMLLSSRVRCIINIIRVSPSTSLYF